MLDLSGTFTGVVAPGERDVWLSVCPDPNLILQIPDTLFPKPSFSKKEILEFRSVHIGKSLGVSYNKPLHIVRGFMQYLYDEDGKQYLDVRNNVPQVGHSNPVVVAALSK